MSTESGGLGLCWKHGLWSAELPLSLHAVTCCLWSQGSYCTPRCPTVVGLCVLKAVSESQMSGPQRRCPHPK
ncbi:unnamed protein product, partial [Rangifer tarandus platyrhynchus]